MAKDIPLSGITDPTHERYKEAAEVRSLIDTDPDVRTIYETARGLEGLVRNAGVHACAVIMSSEPLDRRRSRCGSGRRTAPSSPAGTTRRARPSAC